MLNVVVLSVVALFFLVTDAAKNKLECLSLAGHFLPILIFVSMAGGVVQGENMI
jgi:hypothetical protein